MAASDCANANQLARQFAKPRTPTPAVDNRRARPMITPLVNRSDDVGGATLAVSFVTGPHREGKRAPRPLYEWQFVSTGSIPNYRTAGLSACRLAADPAHPIRHQFRTSGEAVG
jgi:hypothetical protein